MTQPIECFNFPMTVTVMAEARQFNKHGDCKGYGISCLNGSNWEHFPDESDENCGWSPVLGVVYFGSWIVDYRLTDGRYIGIHVLDNEQYQKLCRDGLPRPR